MSIAYTSLRNVRSIHTRIDPLAALPSRLYLTAPLDCTTLTRHARND